MKGRTTELKNNAHCAAFSCQCQHFNTHLSHCHLPADKG